MPNSTTISPLTEATAPRSNSFFTPWRLTCLGVLLLSALVYLPALKGEFLGNDWDDDELVSGKAFGGDSLLHCFTTPFFQHYFRPLISVSFYLENQYAHNRAGHLPNPFFYHQTNILFHVLTTGLVIGLLGAIFPGRRAIAFWAGLLFALQPVQISTTAWIGGRTDALCTLFVAGFAWALVAAARTEGKSRTGLLALSALLFGCALLAKEQALALLPVVPLAFFCFRSPRNLTPQPPSLLRSLRSQGRGRPTPTPPYKGGAINLDSPPSLARNERPGKGVGGLGATLPFAVVTIAYLVAWKRLGASPHLTPPLPLLAQANQAGQTLLTYALMLLTPTPRWINAYTLDALAEAGFLAGLAGLGLLLLTIALFVRWMRREPAAAWLLALVALPILPVANFTTIPSFLLAPYRMGICGIGVAALLGWAFGRTETASASPPLPQRGRGGRGVRAFGTLYALWYGALTVWGVPQWRSLEQIDTVVYRYDPQSLHAFGTLMNLEAEHHAPQVIAETQQFLTRLFGSPDWQTPAQALQRLRANPRILEHIRETQGVQLSPRMAIANLYVTLGSAYLGQHDSSHSLTAFRTAYALAPGYADALFGLGKWEGEARHYPEAINFLRAALRANPSTNIAHRLLGNCLALQNQWPDARDEYAQYVREQPDDPLGYRLLANALRHLGDVRGAEEAERHAANL